MRYAETGLPPQVRMGGILRATDVLGNKGEPTTYAWRVDILTPTVTISSGRAPWQ